jgi:hypothetical protein
VIVPVSPCAVCGVPGVFALEWITAAPAHVLDRPVRYQRARFTCASGCLGADGEPFRWGTFAEVNANARRLRAAYLKTYGEPLAPPPWRKRDPAP